MSAGIIPGVSNPADIPSRGSQPSDLISNSLWWNGPKVVDHEEVPVDQVRIPDECLNEMKSSQDKFYSLLVNGPNGLSSLIHYEDFSILGRLLWVTAGSKRLVSQLLMTLPRDVLKAETRWIRE